MTIVLAITLAAPAFAGTPDGDHDQQYLWDNHVHWVRDTIADAGDITDVEFGRPYVWRVAAAAFVLRDQLNNANQDVLGRRLSCLGFSYQPKYQAVASIPPAPPEDHTLDDVLQFLALASEQLENMLADLHGNYMPNDGCMTSQEHLIVLLPMEGFRDQTRSHATALQTALPGPGEPCHRFCQAEQRDFNAGVCKRCDQNGNCAACPQTGDNFDCNIARTGTSQPFCESELQRPCGPFKMLTCPIAYGACPMGPDGECMFGATTTH